MMSREILQNEHEPDSEKEAELKLMREHIQQSLANPETLKKVEVDFFNTFEKIGISPEQAHQLRDTIIQLLLSSKTLLEIEEETLQLFENMNVNQGDTEKNLVETIHEKLQDRADLIFKQVAPHLENVDGPVIDYGAGDGQVTQQLHDKLGLSIEGVDIRLYKDPNVTVPINIFDGNSVDVPDGAFEAGVITNVLHHDQDNDKILSEINRIVKSKVVVIETVPVGDSEDEMEADKDRTFMNDYFYNRLFHNADVPVPGTYETPQAWINRFKKNGWNVTHQEDLGIDQPMIEDRHYLFVFER